ncbi:MAG: peptidoglycan DD-metalloendopeptidase family protein [Myxococcota bacterium]|nr:peptidoglycan DD-metalloendopeptidase family protein [Myxococcota bacterium]
MSQKYHPVVVLPEDAQVLDLSTESGLQAQRTSLFTIGRYDEVRCIYTQALFGGVRNVHVGIDLGAPAGTPVHAFTDCVIHKMGINADPGDYGPTLVTEQVVEGERIWALFGHLSASSLTGHAVGQKLRRGEVLGWIGSEAENGGWPPHVHFQLARVKPATHDMPGVVTAADRDQAVLDYPDPRCVLGDLY